MKQRIITAAVGLVVFFAVLFAFPPIVYSVAIAIVALIAVHELIMAAGITKNIPLTVLSLAASVFPFLMALGVIKDRNIFILFVTIIVSLMFLMLLVYHEKLSYQKLGAAFLFFTVIPIVFTTLVLVRNQFEGVYGIYYTLLIFGCAWGSDSGAYFGGRFFGKHKLAPKISPKKTIEGVYGGIVGCLVVETLVTVGIYYYSVIIGSPIEIKAWYLIIISVIGSVVSVLGDLTASVIKRQSGIKDFGSIMPGHGGIMDRFDSVIFVAPFFYVLLMLFKL